MINQGSEELVFPPGFRFHPTDDELVNHYLCRKCSSQPIAVPIIKEIDLYKYNPWELPEMALYGEKEWYFFSPRDRKYPNGSRPNRAAGNGYWKATGADKPIGKPNPLGIKKALVFYAGKAPKGVKTNWIMHEYRLANVDRSASIGKKNNSRLDEWVLCRIYNKKGRIEKHFPAVVTDIVKDEKLVISSPPVSHPSSNSDSMPKLHNNTESSWSEDALSPEVQSDAKWMNDLGKSNNGFDDFDFNFGDDGLFGNEVQQQQYQIQMEQDMFMLLDKPYF